MRKKSAWNFINANRRKKIYRLSDMKKKVTQEHSMGCAVACVAARCNITYKNALNFFPQKENAWMRGYYCYEVVAALSSLGFNYTFVEFDPLKHKNFLQIPGSIVFIKACVEYPAGHYLLCTKNGWMNPWANFPNMFPPKSAVQKKFLGKVAYLIYELEAY